jgi:hypothetical protein
MELALVSPMKTLLLDIMYRSRILTRFIWLCRNTYGLARPLLNCCLRSEAQILTNPCQLAGHAFKMRSDDHAPGRTFLCLDATSFSCLNPFIPPSSCCGLFAYRYISEADFAAGLDSRPVVSQRLPTFNPPFPPQ